jgi:Arc/MetJ family transcription regulator
MQAPVEIRYAGVVISRAQEVRSADGESTFFLPGKDPMPVGTVVRLRSGDRETAARVLRAVESTDPSTAGMQVRLIGEAEEAAVDWIPAPAPAPAPLPVKTAPKPGTPTPTVEVDLALMQEAARTPPVQTAESAAVPEAVPVAVGSSLTGALEHAAEAAPEAATGAAATSDTAPAEAKDLDIIITDTPPPVTVAAPESAPPEPASPSGEEARSGADEPGEGEASEENGEGEAGPATDDMPTARPIAGPSGRRKTKRRRY